MSDSPEIKEVLDLRQELEAVRRELDFFDRQHAAAMETVGELSDKVADRDARIASLEAELARLRETIKNIEAFFLQGLRG